MVVGVVVAIVDDDAVVGSRCDVMAVICAGSSR